MTLANVLFNELLKVDRFLILLTVDEELRDISYLLNQEWSTFGGQNLHISEVIEQTTISLDRVPYIHLGISHVVQCNLLIDLFVARIVFWY